MPSGMVICSFPDIIDLWGTPYRRAAEALAAELGLPFENVRKWHERKNIPAERWAAIAATERARRAGVTVAMMAEFAARSARMPDQSDCEAAGAGP